MHVAEWDLVSEEAMAKLTEKKRLKKKEHTLLCSIPFCTIGKLCFAILGKRNKIQTTHFDLFHLAMWVHNNNTNIFILSKTILFIMLAL